MARQPKDDLETQGGTFIFEQVSNVKIRPGLGVFVDPNPDLTPDAEGKIPVYTRGSDSFEMMRYRATRARVDAFAKENQADIKEMGINPDSIETATLISSGFFTETILRSFMGDSADSAVEEETPSWSWRSRENEDDSSSSTSYNSAYAPGMIWKTGKGWVKEEGSKPIHEVKRGWAGYSRSFDDDDFGGYGGSYGGYSGGYSGYQSYSKPKPKYRTLNTVTEDLFDAAKKEMWSNGLRSVENPGDIVKFIALSIIRKMDMAKPEELKDWEIKTIISGVMADIRYDLGYAQRYDALISTVRAYVEEIGMTTTEGVYRILISEPPESPERFFMELLNIFDVASADAQNNLKSLFKKITDEQAEAEKEGEGEQDGEGEEESDHTGEIPIDLGEEPPVLPTYSDHPASWGRMRIIEHPLVPDVKLRKRTVTYRPTDVGTHLGRLDRILTDKRVFKEMRPAPSGSLLVDCSGSMGLSAQNVRDVLDKVPGAVIGLYSGSGASGTLHIVARAGKVAANLDAVIASALRMGGNVVDGPGIEWLSTMPRPRIWYSDGGVTGISDSAGMNLQTIANRLMRKGSVGRIGNQKFLNNAFQQMRRERSVGGLPKR